MRDISRSSVNLDVAPKEGRPGEPADPDTPFRILILGDFSGRRSRGIRSVLAGRRPVLIDRDNFDEVMGNMHPELRINGVPLEFHELDDFHPDNIYRETEVFQKLADERERPISVADPPPPRTSGGSLLDDLMDETGEDPVPPPDTGGDLAEFIKKIVRPHLAEREDPRQKAQAAQADKSAAGVMSRLLHDPDFQELEAAWRGLFLLARGLETGENLKLYVLDASLEEALSDLAGLEKLLTNRERSWAVIAADYVFGQSDDYARALSKFGKIASAAAAPFLAEAAPPGGEAGADWTKLRQSLEARWIGLALPRFLLRLPYGPKTSPVESFEFEEMPKSVHQDYLWGNPVFCCAYLLGKSFLSDGWEMRLGSHRLVEGLPLHSYIEDGGTELKPCAEVLMTEKEAEFLMERGIMPLASMKGQDAVLLVRFQSIAEPLAALAGGWTSA